MLQPQFSYWYAQERPAQLRAEAARERLIRATRATHHQNPMATANVFCRWCGLTAVFRTLLHHLEPAMQACACAGAHGRLSGGPAMF